MKNKSVMQHAFSMVPKINKPRSVFDRSHGYKTTFFTDDIVPIYTGNVLPGDSIQLKHSFLLRLLSPMDHPVMDNLHLDWFYFFVPYRLVWSNFQKFMGEQANPADSISYTIPQCTAPNVAAGGIELHSLHDYLGLPIGPLNAGGGTTGLTFNNLIPRGYQLIWNQWFRDENLQNSVTVDLGDGPDTYTNYLIRQRGKRHDYFTSALPFLQKGSAVTVPLGTTAPIIGLGKGNGTYDQSSVAVHETGFPFATTTTYPFSAVIDRTNLQDQVFMRGSAATSGTPLVYADLTTAAAATINSLRQSIALQQFLENDARGGTRYTEIVRQRWGVTSPDARLQRAELLSLGTSPIKINAVSSTFAGSVSDSTIGLQGAFAVASDVGNGFSKSFTEHGFVICLINVRADLTYQQGVDKHWNYRTRYDLPNPEFMQLGEQPILNRELWAYCPDGTSASQKDGVFGYQERYSEERYSRSFITGNLRSDSYLSLDAWHLSQNFISLPTLGDTFIKSSTPIDRVIIDVTQPDFILDAYFSEKWARVMPTFSVPGLLKL